VILRLSIRRCSALQASQVRRIDGLPFVSIGFLHILQPPITSRISRSITIAGMSGDFCRNASKRSSLIPLSPRQ
jgi:hypothetical protein